MLELYQKLIALRGAEADLADPRLDRMAVEYDEDACWLRIHRGELRVVVNLSDAPQVVPVDGPTVDLLIATARGFGYGPEGVTLAAESGAVVRLATPLG